jgi:hypothetical protein
MHAQQRCATFHLGARHTTDTAGNLPDSEVFSRPNTSVLGLGTVNRKATGTAVSVCLNPVPPNDLDSQRAGFQSRTGAKTMTIASSKTTPILGKVTQGHAPTTTPAQTAFGQMLSLRVKRELRPPLPVDPLARHIAIENALSAALWHMRHGTGTQAMQAATGRAIRAASMLKQACSEATNGGRA